ncbi:MAG: hypothetical protein ABEJ61_03345 [Haloferacaceae archaeon]
MPDWSRRRALHAAVSTAVAALAGCSGEASVSSSPTPAPDDARRVTDYELKQVRNADGVALFGRSDADEPTPTESTPGGVGAPSASTHLTGPEELSAFAFADVPQATALARFVRATDFETRSVYLYQRSIPACYDLRLVGVRRRSDSVTANFCRDLKPADVACERGDRDTVGVAVRLPFAGDGFSGHGTGLRGSCGGPGRAVGEGGGGS